MATAPPVVLQVPGTPSIILPPYAVPAFTAASIALGSSITTIVLESTATVATPFTFGQVFKIGEVAPTDGLVGRIEGVPDVALQMDVKATHPNGSVRHAIISGVTNKFGTMHLIRSVRAEVKSVPVAPADYNAVVKIVVEGVEYSAKPSPIKAWLRGDVVQENVGRVPLATLEGVEHPFLAVMFAQRVYATGQVKLDVAVEHTKAYVAIADITYDIIINVSGTDVYTKVGLTHFVLTRYKKTFWHGEKPAIHIKHNTAYLIATKAIPNYDQSVVISETALKSYANDLVVKSHEPMAVGRFMAAMGTTGGRPDIGLAPDCYVAAILSGDKRAKDIVLASADVGGSWGIHRRDTDGTMFDIIRWPRATLLGTTLDAVNPLTKQSERLPNVVSASKNYPDTSHMPAFAYIPYLLTGDYYYLEELQFWCNYTMYSSNCGYRNYNQGWVKPDQVRGQGWSLRTLAEAAYITPDNHNNKMSFQYWLDCNMEYYRVNYTDGPALPSVSEKIVLHNELGVIAGGFSTAATVKGAAQTGMAPWMDDFFTQSVGHVAELGNAEAARLLKWKAKFPIGRLADSGYCPTNAPIYTLRVRETATSPHYKTLRECREGTLEPVDYVCNFPTTDMTGYPSVNTGFPSNLQPALAMAVDSGVADGDKAWSIFMSRKTKPNYGDGPQFAIVPRKVADVIVVTPPPVIPPVIVPPVIPPTDVKLVVQSKHLSNLTNLTVIVGLVDRIFVYTNQAASTSGEITVVSKSLVKQVKYTVTVVGAEGFTVAKIYPVQAE